MSHFLPREIQAELEAARLAKLRRRSRFRIEMGGETYPVLRMLTAGFTLDADQIDHLRGIVDLYDGPRLMSQCLIVASKVEASELHCTIKWQTIAGETPPLDYVRAADAPRGYLTRH